MVRQGLSIQSSISITYFTPKINRFRAIYLLRISSKIKKQKVLAVKMKVLHIFMKNTHNK